MPRFSDGGSEGSRSNRLERDGPAVHWPTEKEKDAIGCGDQLLSGEVGQVDQRIEWDMPELANVFQKDAVRREAEQCAVGDRGQSIVVARHNPAKVCGLETARFVAVRGRVVRLHVAAERQEPDAVVARSQRGDLVSEESGVVPVARLTVVRAGCGAATSSPNAHRRHLS